MELKTWSEERVGDLNSNDFKVTELQNSASKFKRENEGVLKLV